MAGTSKPKTDKKPVKYEKIDGKPACPVCSRKFPVHSAVTKHLRTHTGERPYACEHCDSKFTKNSGLKRHIERIHLKMLYACKECNKKFNSRELLSYHMNEHSGKTPYQCKICKTEGFSSRDIWMRHLRLIHDVNWKCLACRKFWGENDNFESLKEHIRKGHTLPKKRKDVVKISEHLTISRPKNRRKLKKIYSGEDTQVADEGTKIVEFKKVTELKEVECKEEPDVEVTESKDLIKFEEESEVDVQGSIEIFIDIVTENIKLEELSEAKTKEAAEPEKIEPEIASFPMSTARTCTSAVEPVKPPAENITNPKKTCLIQFKEPANSSKTEAGFVKPDMMGKPIYIEKLNSKSIMNKQQSFGETEKVETKVPKQLYIIEPQEETSPVPVIKTEEKEISNEENTCNKTAEKVIENQEKAVNKTNEKGTKGQEEREKKN